MNSTIKQAIEDENKLHGLTIPTNSLRYACAFFGKESLPDFVATATKEEQWLFNELSKANRSGAEYGYSLAEQEIERLKGLLKDMFDSTSEWLQFKTNNQL